MKIDAERLQRQIRFVVEIDKLKTVVRQTLLTDESRQEDSAEHSWHIAVMALLLSEYADTDHLDILKVLEMMLVHDVVEIDAGDTYCYDVQGHEDKAEREQKAADRIFGILPDDQAASFRALWDEFEERKTPEARFAAALDRLQPLLNNFATRGKMWQRHGVRKDLVMARNRPMEEGAPALWAYAAAKIQESVNKGFLAE